jgi:hypothetical protein
MTRNSNRKKNIRERMATTGEPYSVAAKSFTFGVPVVEDNQTCPGYFTWSAFGASYPDTVCASVVQWDDENYQGHGLCDADDDFREKGVPCPFCSPESFLEYQFGGGFYVPMWAETEEPVPDRTPIRFHETGNSLWMSATHPKYGDLKVQVVEQDYDYEDKDDFTPFILASGADL